MTTTAVRFSVSQDKDIQQNAIQITTIRINNDTINVWVWESVEHMHKTRLKRAQTTQGREFRGPSKTTTVVERVEHMHKTRLKRAQTTQGRKFRGLSKTTTAVRFSVSQDKDIQQNATQITYIRIDNHTIDVWVWESVEHMHKTRLNWAQTTQGWKFRGPSKTTTAVRFSVSQNKDVQQNATQIASIRIDNHTINVWVWVIVEHMRNTCWHDHSMQGLNILDRNAKTIQSSHDHIDEE